MAFSSLRIMPSSQYLLSCFAHSSYFLCPFSQVAFHLLLQRYDNCPQDHFPTRLNTIESRIAWEHVFLDHIVNPLFPNGVISPATSAAIAAVKADCGDKANVKRLETLFGASAWNELVSSDLNALEPSTSLSLASSSEPELSPSPLPPPLRLPSWVWRIRRPVTMANFRLWFHGTPTRKN